LRLIKSAETHNEYHKALEAVSPIQKGSNSTDVPDILKEGNAIVVLLEITPSSPLQFKEHEFVSAANLQRHLKRPNVVTVLKSVYVVEGLSPDYVTVLGQHFAIGSEFFQQHQLHFGSQSSSNNVDHPLKRPHGRMRSDIQHQFEDSRFHLQYCELRQFDRLIDNLPFVCPKTGRDIDMVTERSRWGATSTTAVLRRKVSWWSRSLPNGAWDGRCKFLCDISFLPLMCLVAIILCDPPLTDVAPSCRIVDYITLQNVPYQGGYKDVMPGIDPKEACKTVKHPQHSMRVDLCYYFRHRATHFSDREWMDPYTSSVFIKKIAASQYCRVAEYVNTMLPSLTLRLSTSWHEEQEQYTMLQRVANYCGDYKEDIVENLRSLGFRPVVDEGLRPRPNDCDWRDCEFDFHYVYHRLNVLEQRIWHLLNNITGHSLLAGNRQELERAAKRKRISLLLLLVGPLVVASKLLGVQHDFLPTGPQWSTFAISASGSVLVTICAVSIWS
jgi:hypothetical protein